MEDGNVYVVGDSIQGCSKGKCAKPLLDLDRHVGSFSHASLGSWARGTMFVQVFETVDYLTFHLPWGLDIFTESVFMYDICCLKIIERDLKICVLGT